ncbi:hypothetical protein ABFS83_01G018100 [Erythranthe nasuta]
MAAEEEAVLELKWEGKVIAKLNKATPQAVWLLLEDFCSFHKWLPTIDTCYKVVDDDEEGLVRYCAATTPADAGGGGGGGVVKWCHEKLLDIDPVGMRLSYEVLDNNMGLKSYRSTIKVVPAGVINGGDEGCQIEWSFFADPIDGLSYDDMVNYLDVSLQGMALNMEKALMDSSLMEKNSS